DNADAFAGEPFVLCVAVADLAQVNAVVQYGADAGRGPHAAHPMPLPESVLPGRIHALRVHLEQPHDERRLGWVHLATLGLHLTDVAVAEHATTTDAAIGDSTAPRV